jgi:16S rRNA (guanine527-N7)-methyltransferase
MRPDEAGKKASRAGGDGAAKAAARRDVVPSAGADGARTAPRPKADPDPDAVLAHAGTAAPSLDELRSALDWAFQGEEGVAPALLDRYARHAELVLEGNRVMNLTSVVEAREVAAKHYLDSWRASRLTPLVGRSVLDLGCGAGFPGVPIALAEPQARVCLLDSTRKRCEFVEGALAALDIANASAVWGRGEEHLARHKYDIVMMRALSSVRENVRLLRKVKHSHKDLVMLKGPAWSREVRAAEREAERLGFRLDTVWEHELPGGMGSRAILVYRAPGGHGL